MLALSEFRTYWNLAGGPWEAGSGSTFTINNNTGWNNLAVIEVNGGTIHLSGVLTTLTLNA